MNVRETRSLENQNWLGKPTPDDAPLQVLIRGLIDLYPGRDGDLDRGTRRVASASLRCFDLSRRILSLCFDKGIDLTLCSTLHREILGLGLVFLLSSIW